MASVILLLILALKCYFYVIIASVMVSWLVVFGVLNTRNSMVAQFCRLLNRLTNPPIMAVRRVMPPMGGIDLSPMVVIFGIYFLQKILYQMLYR